MVGIISGIVTRGVVATVAGWGPDGVLDVSFSVFVCLAFLFFVLLDLAFFLFDESVSLFGFVCVSFSFSFSVVVLRFLVLLLLLLLLLLGFCGAVGVESAIVAPP